MFGSIFVPSKIWKMGYFGMARLAVRLYCTFVISSFTYLSMNWSYQFSKGVKYGENILECKREIQKSVSHNVILKKVTFSSFIHCHHLLLIQVILVIWFIFYFPYVYILTGWNWTWIVTSLLYNIYLPNRYLLSCVINIYGTFEISSE